MAVRLGSDLLAELPAPPPRLAQVLNRRMAGSTAPERVLHLHRWLYDRTGGRIGHGLIGAPTLLLYTIGRRSGRRRCSALNYWRDGDRLVVAASNEGADQSPAWLHNLRSRPEVEVQVGRLRLTGRAVVVDASDSDWRRLWDMLNAHTNGRYARYQAKTSRPIPLVALIPTARDGGGPGQG